MFFRRQKRSLPSFNQQLAAAANQGFTVEPEGNGPARFRVSKLGCAAVLEPAGNAGARYVQRPGWVIKAGQLRTIHQFDEQLRRVLRLSSLYNESPGTVSSRYVYDRVEGRE
jgi:hypothetical protein